MIPSNTGCHLCYFSTGVIGNFICEPHNTYGHEVGQDIYGKWWAGDEDLIYIHRENVGRSAFYASVLIVRHVSTSPPPNAGG